MRARTVCPRCGAPARAITSGPYAGWLRCIAGRVADLEACGHVWNAGALTLTPAMAPPADPQGSLELA